MMPNLQRVLFIKDRGELFPVWTLHTCWFTWAAAISLEVASGASQSTPKVLVPPINLIMGHARWLQQLVGSLAVLSIGGIIVPRKTFRSRQWRLLRSSGVRHSDQLVFSCDSVPPLCLPGCRPLHLPSYSFLPSRCGSWVSASSAASSFMVILALEAQKEPWKAACIRPDALRICSPRDSAPLEDASRLPTSSYECKNILFSHMTIYSPINTYCDISAVALF